MYVYVCMYVCMYVRSCTAAVAQGRELALCQYTSSFIVR